MSPARTARSLLLAALTTAGLSSATIAQEVPAPPGAFKGFDGISAECIVQTPDPFATGTCKMLFALLKKHSEKAGVKVVQAGSQVWEDVKIEDRAHLEPPAGSDLKAPARLTFFVRGAQSAKITGGFTRIAIWTPAEIDGRKGKLVLWEHSTLGTGPRNGLRKALVASFGKHLDSVLTLFADHNKDS
jgi:hypothetical protein